MSYKGIFIPELKVFNIVSSIVDAIKEDLNDNIDDSKTFLYKIFQDQKASNYEFFVQAKELYGRLGGDPRELKVRLFYDSARSDVPTIHINLPSENTNSNGLGTDQNFDSVEYEDVEREYHNNFTRGFQANYQVLFTSPNSMEVVLLYHSIRAGIIQLIPSLEIMGFRNLSISGNDIFLDPSVVPTGVFIRGLTLTFGYDVTVPSINKSKFYSNLFSKIKFQKQ